MKLLITGGCGFLGSNLAAYALEKGYEVFIFDSLYRVGAISNLNWLKTLGKFTFIHSDIRNSNDVARTIKNIKPDSIFHLAGQVAMTTSLDNPRMDFEVNVLGSFNVLEAVRDYSPATLIIYSSTNKVYGDLEQYTYQETATRYNCIEKPNGFDEFTALDFHSPYGVSKGSADQYMLDYARMFGLKTVVFRHSSMYGGRQFATADQGWIGWFCQQAIGVQSGKLKEPFTISGNGKQVRDVLHAEDMARLYFKVAENIDKVSGHAFNIGGGIENSLSLLELFIFFERKLKIQLNYTKLAVRSSDQKVFVADLTKAKKLLNWQPEVSYQTGIDKMLEWVSHNYIY